RRRHTRSLRDWSSDVCSSDLLASVAAADADKWTVRLGFAVVAGAGVLAAAVVATLPKLASTRALLRFRLGRWLNTRGHCNKRNRSEERRVGKKWRRRGAAIA